jgi:glucan biosynthesis protein C
MSKTADRQYYIDWLRAGAMFLLVFYHSGRLFDFEGWHLKNAELSLTIQIFNRFLDIWQMPLFFLLAGMSVGLALQKRTVKEFIRERVLRLFVPLVFGMLVIVPLQVYTERLFRGQFSGSFLEWWPHTFSAPYPEGNLSWHHLWFLAYLFTFTLILLPIFRYFRKESGRRLIAWGARFMTGPALIQLPALPLVLIDLALRPTYGYGNQNLVSDWANFLFYLTILLYGYWLIGNDDLLRSFQANRATALGVAVGTYGLLWLIGSGLIDVPQLEKAGTILGMVFRSIATWAWLVAIVGYGRERLNFSNRVLKYASSANMPVYILHQTVIIMLGYFIIQLDMPVGAKYAEIVFATFCISLALYEVIKRTAVTRFLFGMKV